MTPLVLANTPSQAPLARLLEALGAVFETRSLGAVLTPPDDARRALILSEEQLIAAVDARPHGVRDLLRGYRDILVYPFQGTPAGLQSLATCVGGRAEARDVDDERDLPYSIQKEFSAAGPFAGLTISPSSTRTDRALSIRDALYPVSPVVVAGGASGLLTRITVESTNLFVLSSTAVFDVAAETVDNLDARRCFSGLVPLLFFLRHARCAFWETAYRGANVIIDDLNLRPRYGFVETRTLAQHVDRLGCAVSIGFIPWNCNRTSRVAVELFRSRWPRCSVCIHGCDHVGAEFSTSSVAATTPMIAASLDRMQVLKSRAGIRYDKVMVFPQGCFSRPAMEALRQSDFLAAVNTELVDHRTQTGVRTAELLKPAVTSFGGFPLFLRRKLDQPVQNFALDLLIGKPCLVVTHHDDFKAGMQPLVSLVESLNALDPGLDWTNLETIASQTYSTRSTTPSAVDIRLLASSTRVARNGDGATCTFEKAEPLTDKDLQIRIGGVPVKAHRRGETVLFESALRARQSTTVEVTVSPPAGVSAMRSPLTYRGKVAARRYLSEFRDNYVAKSSWATAAVKRVRRSRVPAVSR